MAFEHPEVFFNSRETCICLSISKSFGTSYYWTYSTQLDSHQILNQLQVVLFRTMDSHLGEALQLFQDRMYVELVQFSLFEATSRVTSHPHQYRISVTSCLLSQHTHCKTTLPVMLNSAEQGSASAASSKATCTTQLRTTSKLL